MDWQLASPANAEMIEFLRRLVQTSSLSTQEGAVAELIAAEMHRLGLPNVQVDAMGNVIARLGPGGGPTLLFDAHMDTVAAGDPAAWRHDPFGAVVQNDVLYGRGAADMKGAIAAMVYGAKRLHDAGLPQRGTLVLAMVVQEEPCEGMAIREVLEGQGIHPDYCVLGEPTNLALARGHRGRLEASVTVRGVSSHASAPDAGQNAVYAAARVIVGIELLAQQLNHDSVLGRGSIAVTQIESMAESHNAVPHRCTLYVDRRLTSDETEVKALTDLRRIIGREGVAAEVTVTEYQATSYTGYACRLRQYFPAWTLPDNHPLLGRAALALEGVLGGRPRQMYWAFSTDGVYTAGVAGIPTIGFGPGEERYAHACDEQVRVPDVVAAARGYAAIAAELLR
ncbi:MAG TPA: YgeY family selenium metabolism-linked hydrolase [Anaerolineae bacterium]|nr:YgeY family selenium metabolism-linked hydrolase [Anaerolineae bacterium]